jgi:selenide,water dikinase
LTKPIGIGIITTAQKKGIVSDSHLKQAVTTMLTLNKPGAQFGKLPYVNAMTDVTGFGLLGHLVEMCEGSNLSAEINFIDVPRFDFLKEYIQQKSMPGGTQRNWESYGHKISTIDDEQKAILADPQTSGGLLVSVDPGKKNDFEAFAKTMGLELKSFGKMIPKNEIVVEVS